MEQYPIEDYRAEIAAMRLDGDQERLRFISAAARFAALPNGDAKFFLRWPELAEKCADFRELIRARVREGLWDLKFADDDYLGIAVINAEDFSAFLTLARELTPTAAKRWLDGETAEVLEHWRHEANKIRLDAEASKFLEGWNDIFPVREDLRLDPVKNPAGFELGGCRVIQDVTPLPEGWCDADVDVDDE
jgi:hypothetical protein